ncbi:FMN-binding protein MioC [Volucribacter amazonae]|uniref:FMN-binding protein MioC n=1 Tax=Volucribacter amazonae TaxID=256731 RepID=A0A9X4P9U6_9PAST|nr:FMN-binding protein MioC [Volucribacter amazonae]MDG6895265.1 FMN-binding protein MioC [Volucribacter amazonae]
MKEQICLITGSTLGGAEYVAEHLDDLLQQQGWQTQLLHGADYNDVIEQPLWLVITSTHGAGEIPENLNPLFEQIQQADLDLSGLKFAVVGLGSSDYDTFCFAVNKVEDILQSKGATLLCPSLRIDVVKESDHDQCAEDWLPNFTQQII